MESMIKETPVTFKEIEQEMFRKKCREGQEETRDLLERYDRYLFEQRDRKQYRDKGLRKSVVKTVYGEVEYSRHVYQCTDEYGARYYVYLLDEVLGMERVGKFSENFVDCLVEGITVQSYRGCAESLSGTTGQTISPAGVWNIVQELGRRLEEEERELVRVNAKGLSSGTREAPVLFEEIDGVYLSMQREDRKKNPKGIAEMKVGIAYDGWVREGNGRYRLDGKVVSAGFSPAQEFHAVMEAKIAAEYDLDETQLRILNGDGAGWIRNVPDAGTVFQLDIFHRNKAVTEKIPYETARQAVRDYLQENDTDGLFDYLETYRDSLTEDDEIGMAEELIRYLTDNRDGLIPYKDRDGLEIPECPEGLEYRNLGTMENHIYSIAAQRLKGRHRSWGKPGATNMAKVLAKKCEGKLYEVTRPSILAGFDPDVLERMQGECLSAAASPSADGKGYEYPLRGSLMAIENAMRGDPVKLFRMAGY